MKGRKASKHKCRYCHRGKVVFVVRIGYRYRHQGFDLRVPKMKVPTCDRCGAFNLTKENEEAYLAPISRAFDVFMAKLADVGPTIIPEEAALVFADFARRHGMTMVDFLRGFSVFMTMQMDKGTNVVTMALALGMTRPSLNKTLRN